jgi:filamentous hemagglutinin family protein
MSRLTEGTAAAVSGRLTMKRSGILLGLAVAYWLTVDVVASAQIVPIGDAGTVVLPGQPGQVLIQGGTQAGGNLFHQFQQFGLSADQRATFQANPTVGNIFSRVTGGNASVINGLLQVTGGNANLFLINPAGVIFGKNARLDLPGSFTATTATALEFSGQKWLNVNGLNQYGDLTGNVTGYAWLNNAPNAVVNAGELQVKPGQQVMLSGGTVINTGTIAALGGKVTIAAVTGEKLIRVSQDNQVLSLDLPLAAKSELSQNTTAIAPTRLPQLLAGRDVAEATGIAIAPNGDVELRSGQAPIPLTPNQAVVYDQPQVIVAGEITAPNIDVIGERIDLQAANLNANQAAGGGQIRVGGDFQGQGDLPKAQRVNVDAASRLTADATVQGDGGKVIVWSDGATQFAGEASAKGGVQSGNGGLVETSGKQTLNVDGARVNASAVQGKAGEWLLDPSDITIANGGPGALVGGTFDPATSSLIAPGTIETALDGGTNVTITTAGGAGGNGDIRLNNAINQTGGGNASLTLTGRRFTRAAGARINLTSTGDLTVNLNQVNSEPNPSTTNIQNAINAIGTGTGARQINLGVGNYVGAAGTDLVTINKNVTINGAQPNAQINGQNAARNVWVTAGTVATLRNLAVINGLTPAGESGAGILNEGNLTLDRVTVINNQAGLDGGGIDSSEPTSSLVINRSTFLNNRAGVDGGGLFLGGNTQVIDVAVNNNQAGNAGGGIYNLGNLTIDQFSVSSNTALLGGGIANIGVGSRVTASNFLIDRNIAAGDRGGGVFSFQGAIAFTRGVFDQNQAARLGAGVALDNAVGTLQDVVISNHQVIDAGAGINLEGTSALTLISALVRNNRANYGGAINTNTANGPVNITDSTFRTNTANVSGGAIYAETDTTISSTEFDGNVATVDAGAIYQQKRTLSLNSTIFRNNVSDRDGGAIAVFQNAGLLDVLNSSFINNRGGSGGAIFADPLTTTNITGTSFVGNQALAGNRVAYDGGAIWNAGTATIASSFFDANIAQQSGGAIWNSGGLTIQSTTLNNNQATNDGGAIATTVGDLALNSSVLTSNTANNGGALDQNLGRLTIADSQFLTNRALVDGGGLNLLGTTNSSIQRTLIQGNQAASGGGVSLGGVTSLDLTQVALLGNQAISTGGGLKARSEQGFAGTLNITDSSIIANSAGNNNGGGLDFDPAIAGATLNLTGSVVNQNRAGEDGGGVILGINATGNITNSTIVQNQANRHGGGFSTYAPANLQHVTIANNQADADADGNGQGGGIFIQSFPRAIVRTANSIIAANRNSIAPDVAGDFVDQGNNLIGIVDGSTGFVNSALLGTAAAPIDPLLAPLSNYDGLTETVALLPGSRAIDAGNSAIPTDPRGIARVGVADIGAFESRGFTLVSPTGSGQSAQINAAFANPLQVTIGSNFGEPVDGGQIFFTAPTTGAGVVVSSNPTPVTIAGGVAPLTLTANSIAGTYDILATTNGLPPVAFTLTNTLPPVVPPVPPVVPPVPPVVPPVPPVVPPVPPVVPPVPPVVPPVIPPVVPPIPPVAPPPPAAAPVLPMTFGRSETIDPPRPEALRLAPPIDLAPTILESLDDSFTQDYVQQFGMVAAQTVTAPQVQSLLSDLDKKRGLRSAVIYAMFVPEAFSPQTQDDNDALSAAIPSLIRATERRDSDRLELIFITADGKLKRRSTNYQRSQVEEQTNYFWLVNNDVENSASFQQFGQQMQQWLFAPIAPEIQAAKISGLMYVLDQGLRSLPLASMQGPQGTLLKDYTISVIPSLGMLDRQQTVLKNQTTLAMGASKFTQLVPLPAVPQELAMIQQQGFPGQTFLNEQFTLAQLMQQQRQIRPGILHLATHADFNAGQPQNSFIQFNDQRLTLDNVDRLGLRDSNLELLILSACNTATGDPSAELGFTGMASLFGVRTAIGSLWSVSDLGTLAFMSEFYGRLAQTPSRADALRQTQLAMQQGQVRLVGGQLVTSQRTVALPRELAQVADTTFTHPYYWSGFTMVGNPW